MKKVISIVLIVLLVALAVFACRNKERISSAYLKAKSQIMEMVSKPTFKKVSSEDLPDGTIKTTFEASKKVGVDIDIVIISKDSMVLKGVQKEGEKTVATFQPGK